MWVLRQNQAQKDGGFVVKRKRFSVEQITGILKQAELGTSVQELCRVHGVSEQSFNRWKKIYGGMEPSEARELKQLREENAKLKRLVADLSLDKAMLRIPDQVDRWFRLNVTGRSGGTWPRIPLEGDRFSAMTGITGHDPEWAVRFNRNEPAGLALELSFAGLSCPIFTSGEPMSAKRSAMRKIKEVLRLKFEAKLSHERIAAATGVSKGAVTNYVQRALQKGLAWLL
jgi:putative transposase